MDQNIPETKARDFKEWKTWLAKNHSNEERVWLIIAKQKAKLKSITMSEAIAGALCFGWVDSRKQTIDEKFYKVYFTPRKKNSSWSAANIRIVERLTEAGEMHISGLEAFKSSIDT